MTNESNYKFWKALTRCNEYLSENSRAGQLCIQYIFYIDVFRRFIRPERTGNWQNHLTVVGQMLNLFAATGHFPYAKSAKL